MAANVIAVWRQAGIKDLKMNGCAYATLVGVGVASNMSNKIVGGFSKNCMVQG
jgi:hypothetical protein